MTSAWPCQQHSRNLGPAFQPSPLYDPLLTVEYDDCEDGEVEEDAGPRGGVDHGEDDGDHEDDDLDRQRPHDARRQRASVKADIHVSAISTHPQIRWPMAERLGLRI